MVLDRSMDSVPEAPSGEDELVDDSEVDKLLTESDVSRIPPSEEREFQRMDPADMETLTMEVTVDVSDFDAQDRRVLAKLATIYEDAFSEAVAKNRDYSWSFLRTGSKLAATDGTPFESAARAQAYGLLTRAGDKRERILENVYGNGDGAVSAPASETAAEAGNYYFFLSFVLANPELADSFLDS